MNNFAPNDSVEVTDLFQGQVRLSKIYLYNWGSFSDLHEFDFSPNGTVVTGETGAGKTTALDAHLTLLTPTHGIRYNAAAAKERAADRDLMSYIRGAYAQERDGSGSRSVCLRPGATASLILAVYDHEDGNELSLGSMFWINGVSNQSKDIARIYFTSRTGLDPDGILKGAGNKGPRGLKEYLSDQPSTQPFSTFRDYHESALMLLGVENPNAPGLLARAMGMKEVSNLTSLLRDLVLEPSEVRAAAQTAIDGFAALKDSHEKLVEACEQDERLANMPDAVTARNEAHLEKVSITSAKNYLDIFLAEQTAAVLQVIKDELDIQVLNAEAAVQQAEREFKDIQEDHDRLTAQFAESGGNEIQVIEAKIKSLDDTVIPQVTQARVRYTKHARVAGYGEEISEVEFLNRATELPAKIEKCDEELKVFETSHIAKAAHLHNLSEEMQSLSKEIREIESRKHSSVDVRLQQCRDDLCQTLGLSREILPFAAELMEVKDGEMAWQGAIERALGRHKLRLLVPESLFRQTAVWMNTRHLGVRLSVEKVADIKGMAKFKDDGFLLKIKWKRHEYSDWLKHYMAEVDLHCVEDGDELGGRAYSITREGAIHWKYGSLDKDDRRPITDTRDWCLGFDNTRLLAERKERFQALGVEYSDCQNEKESFGQKVAKAQMVRNGLDELMSFEWTHIDVEHQLTRREFLAAERDAFLDRREDLQAIQQQLADCKVARDEAKDRVNECVADRASVRSEADRISSAFRQALEKASNGVPDQARGILTSSTELITIHNYTRAHEIADNVRKKLENGLATAINIINRCGNTINTCMVRFTDRWEHISSEWGVDKDDDTCVQHYLDYLTGLREEALPEFRDAFQELLNRQTDESLTGVLAQIEHEHAEIDERIETINGVLKRTEFQDGTYLKIVAEKHVKGNAVHLQQLTRHARQLRGSEDTDARFSAIGAVIKQLEDACNSRNIQSSEIIDPRYQRTFYAEEIDVNNGDVVNYLGSSESLSGGEKEAFAGVIVAASLAYVLTPDGFSTPAYCTVVIDEAFSNTSDERALKVLNIFKEMGLHVILVTPWKSTRVAERTTDSVIIVSKNTDSNLSYARPARWEEIPDEGELAA
ncbi:ATP-binding protein [Mangrovimicrobium sediminis]|nr:ATP-binding protein [Haliea sp. SAOS-164]